MDVQLHTQDGKTNLFPNIEAANIPPKAVTNDKLADGSVNTVKIADKSVTKAKLDSALQTEINGKATQSALNTTNSNVSALQADMKRVAAANNDYCGRYWDFNNTTPRAAGYVGSLEMLQQLPTLLGLGGYLVKNDHSRKKLSATTHYKYADGTTAKLDGSEGHYQAGWGHGWSYIWEWNAATKILALKISLSKKVGWYWVPVGSDSASGFATIDRANSTLVSYCNRAAQYRGGNNDSSKDGKYNSLLGNAASTQDTATFMAMAKKNGAGWLCSTGRMVAAWAYLFFAIMGTFKVDEPVNNSLDANGLRQGGLGGFPYFVWDQWSTYNGNNPFIPMDAGADKGDFVGTIPYTVTKGDGSTLTWNMPCFFGFKNFYDYLWRQTCDEFLECNADKSQTHYQVLEPYYSDFTFGTKDAKVRKGTTGPISSNWKYISRMAFNGGELMPTEVNGTAATLMSDGYYNSASTSGLRLALRSADALGGDHGGFCVLYGDGGLSDAYADWGSSLSEVTEEFKVTPVTEADMAA